MKMNKSVSGCIIPIVILVLTVTSCDNSYEQSFNEGYESGYEAGHDDGYSEGYNDSYIEDALIVDPYDFGYSVGNVDGFYLSKYSSDIDTYYVFSDYAKSCYDDGYFDGYSNGYDEYVSVLRNNKEDYSIKDLPLIEVESEAIHKVGYDNEESLLVIEYIQGDQYIYSSVDCFEMVNILSADSPGKYVNENIKGIYEYQKLE
jgi:hypothetical protein